MIAHNIRNPESRGFAAAGAVRAPCRWCLTGTPIQNRLEDFAALVSFIRVPSLESVNRFNTLILDPIQKKKKYAFGRLRALVKATCLRRTKRSTGSGLNLPNKEETTLVLDLEQHNRELYNFFKYQAATAVQTMRQRKLLATYTKGISSRMILPLINNLRRICDHGSDLLHSEALQAWHNRDVDLIDWQLMAAGLSKCDGCGGELEDGDEVVVPVELACGHLYCTTCYTSEWKDSQQLRETCAKCSKASPPLPTGSSDGQGMAAEDGYKPGVKVDALLQNLSRERSLGMDQDGSGTKR
jgi:SNF2 family DNA or RNA helicase